MTGTPNNLIIFHAQCHDGFTAAWIAAKWHQAKGLDFELRPWQYQTPAPTSGEVSGKDVYILDFSFPRADLIRLNRAARSLLVLDHHASAQRALKGLKYCRFDMLQSGAGLTLQHFNNSLDLVGTGGMDLVEFIQDYDLWRFEYKETMPLHYYIDTVPHTLHDWDKLVDDVDRRLKRILTKGQAIEKYVNLLVEQIADQCYLATLPSGLVGDATMIVNCPRKLTSQVCHELLERHTDYDWVAAWHLAEPGRYQFGLRSRPGTVDVGKLATRYGGGGHPTAAGFGSNEL